LGELAPIARLFTLGRLLLKITEIAQNFGLRTLLEGKRYVNILAKMVWVIFWAIWEPLWLSGKVVKNEKIIDIQRTRVCSPPRATSLKKCFGRFLQKLFYSLCVPLNQRVDMLLCI
jgi:hypothetical protein